MFVEQKCFSIKSFQVVNILKLFLDCQFFQCSIIFEILFYQHLHPFRRFLRFNGITFLLFQSQNVGLGGPKGQLGSSKSPQESS